MLTASEVRSMTKRKIADTQYILEDVQCKIIQAAINRDSKVWIRFNTRYLKNRSNLKGIANDVVKILTDNGFEAEFDTFADAEYEEYLRFRISWEEQR